ncbi:NAD(P)H-dependent oxidoreductase subunit E [Oceanispirochaeta crateris]|uniref:NAD(P)H-dependent oxidoreductase subunit E n=1 Tax=Oceanispirochaeta crateris TaxID=2518645 RepID=A0A5C1QMJ6_9SPIO|nr:NAD(P)H-dependent oxidoreductase subunit E [Oceanispirochaeta crateris]QEN09283.1 NAD(P)H-dependent oxidoreductase subunit E [Oceanispirochaeta crateris]
MPVEAEELKMTESLISFINEWKEKPGNLIMVLHRVQEEYGYIPRNIAFELGKMLDVPLAKIYGVVTFYHYFKLEKPGKHTVSVCMGTACYLKGGQDLVSELEQLLGVGCGGTTEDKQFSLQAVRCIGCCGLAPVLTIGQEVFGKLTTEMLPEVISKFK